MRKMYFWAVLLSTVCILSSCGTTNPASKTSNQATSTSNGTASSGLGNLLGALLGNSSEVKKADLIGTWNYEAPDCRFESENLLKQAGGEIAAKQVEAKLSEAFSKVGIVKGTCKLEFTENGTCKVIMGGHTINATYVFDEATRQLTLSTAFGLANMTGTVYKSGKKISVLFDGQKLLTLISWAGSLSSSTTVKSVSSILGSYDGMLVGLELVK